LSVTDKITELIYTLTEAFNSLFTLILNLVVLTYFLFVIVKIVDIVTVVVDGVRNYEI